MSIKILNEGFEKIFSSVKQNKELKEAYDPALKELSSVLLDLSKRIKNGKINCNLKSCADAFQNIIENMYPDKSWWEVTDVNIQNDLFDTQDPEKTALNIIKNIREKSDRKIESLKESEMAESKQRRTKKPIKESLRRKRLGESEKEPTIKRYSDVRPRSERKYWYFTTHGVQPGSIPRDLNVLEVRDGQNDRGTWGTYVMLDGVLNTSELKKYDMRELVPPMHESKKQKYRLKESYDYFETEDAVYSIHNGKHYVHRNEWDKISPAGKYWKQEISLREYTKAYRISEYNKGHSLKESKKSIKESFAKKHAKKLKESHRRKLTESFDDMEVFMNTWANYNENGADSGITPTGWMSIDDAIEYCEEYADYEPFINDTDNIPFDDINEYSNASSVLQELKELQESGVDEDVLEAIIEATGYSVKEAIEIAERGDYYWYPGLSDYTDLAYAVIDEIGSLKDALGDRIINYIDEDQMRREYRWDIRETMRDTAEQEVDDAHAGEVDISNVPTSKEFGIDEWFDENDEYTEDDLREQISDDLEYEYDSAPVSFDIEVSNDGKKVTAKNIEWDGYDREQEIEDWMDEHEDEWLDMIIGEEIEAAERGEADLSNYFDYEAFGRDLSFDGYTITDKGIILVN